MNNWDAWSGIMGWTLALLWASLYALATSNIAVWIASVTSALGLGIQLAELLSERRRR